MDYKMTDNAGLKIEKKWRAIDPSATRDELSLIETSQKLEELRPIAKQLCSEKSSCKILYSDKTIADLEGLISNSPNMSAYIDTVIAQVYLHTQFPTETPLRFLPTLLVGPPGVGKTYIVKRVAEALRFPCREIQLAQATEAFILSGCPRGYSNSSPGELALAMANSLAINPVVILDEIDKASFYQSDRPTITGPLLRVLERETAGAFEDSSLRMPMDLQHISWIATANDLEGIPDSILSRFHIIQIDDLNSSDKYRQIQIICEKVLKNLEIESIIEVTVSKDAVDRYKHLSIRTWQQWLQLAITEQFHRRGSLEIIITSECLEKYDSSPISRSIGFVT